MIERWTTLEHRITYHDRWLTVRSDRCVTPSGLIVDPYHVLEYPTWVNVVAITPEPRVVLVREYRHGVGEVVVGIPGGVMDPEDASPDDTVRRELREETGYTAARLIRLGKSYANAGSQNNLMWSYLAIGAQRTHEPAPDATEEIEVLQEDLAAFIGAIEAGTITVQAMHITTLLWAVRYMTRNPLPGLEDLRRQLAASPT